MEITYTTVKGTQAEKPAAVDQESSNTYIYLRKNIEQVEVKDKMTGTTTKCWQYDEAKITANQYAVYLAEQNSAAIDDLLVASLGGE